MGDLRGAPAPVREGVVVSVDEHERVVARRGIDRVVHVSDEIPLAQERELGQHYMFLRIFLRPAIEHRDRRHERRFHLAYLMAWRDAHAADTKIDRPIASLSAVEERRSGITGS